MPPLFRAIGRPKIVRQGKTSSLFHGSWGGVDLLFGCRRGDIIWRWLRLFESHLLCDKVVEHPHGKESEQSPVLETLRNDRVACLRFCRAECQMDGFAQTLRG